MKGSASLPKLRQLVKLQPRLNDLRAEIRSIQHRALPQYFCANAVWYGERAGYDGYPGIKPRVEELVGWHAGHPDTLVNSQEAYHVAYNSLYELLPDCDPVGCMCQFGPWIAPPVVAGNRALYEHRRREWQRVQPIVAPFVFQFDHYRCRICGCGDSPENPLSVDHIVALSIGGTNEPGNLWTACRRCNSSKGAKPWTGGKRDPNWEASDAWAWAWKARRAKVEFSLTDAGKKRAEEIIRQPPTNGGAA